MQKVLTKPEIEMLMIIHEGIFDDFSKNKSKLSPSSYYKTKHSDYNKSYAFAEGYFGNLTDEQLVNILHQYDQKRKRCHEKDELSLTSLLK